MAAPRQMTAQTLNALKGWPQMAAVDFHAEFDATNLTALSLTRVPAGAVVHVSATTGKFILGAGDESVDGALTKANAVMPMFTFNASDDPDVSNDGGDPATEKGVFIPISPTGQAMALVAVGAYELVSTNYVVASAASLVPNVPLTSPKTGANAGKLDVGVLYTDVVVGICSRGVVDNGYGTDAVAFWPFPVFPSD